MQYYFLTSAQIVDVHSDLINQWGGNDGSGHRGASYEGVEAVVAAVRNSYYGDPHELAAAYAVYIVQGHVFLDGNKRSGEAALKMFLEGNGYEVILPDKKLRRLMVELQKRSKAGGQVGELIKWLASEISR